MTLHELLVERKLTSVLIVDDGYDLVPRAEDIVADDDAWSNFLADIGNDRAKIVEAFPAFEEMDASELRRSDAFVAATWKIRGAIREELWNHLFSAYDQAAGSDRKFLHELETAIQRLGLTPLRSGREITTTGRDAGIIFADLYLGTAQEPANIDRSLERLQNLLRGREDNPPLVILMSRSELLDDKKTDFRDRAKLLGAMFRVHRKPELLDGATLVRTLERLALHQPDSVRVARFLHRWESGLADASSRFLKGIRRLDLSDYAQIREVLLAFEGQPLGSYLLDVFDRVLQHEIEGDEGTISAAEELNSIDPDRYPAPYIAGSVNLQDLVYRSIWQNPKRLSVKTTVAALPVGFGDVLIKRTIIKIDAEAPPSAAGAQVTDVPSALETWPDSFVVITPACDLIRQGGTKRILLAAGKLSPLTHKDWNYKEDSLKTPIVVLSDERKMCIKWDARDLRTLLPTEIDKLISEPGAYAIALRLRESHALELQQRILSSLGRVGLIAQMPATFPVTLSAYFGDTAGALQPIQITEAVQIGGVCYTGRDADGEENSRLVLTEAAIDELLTTISNMREEAVHTKARDTLKRLQGSTAFAEELQRGLKAPSSNKPGFQHLRVSTTKEGGEPTLEIVGMIGRNPRELKTEGKYSAFVLVLVDDTPAIVPAISRTDDPPEAEPFPAPTETV